MNASFLIQLSLLGALAAYIASAGQIVLRQAQSARSQLGVFLALIAVTLHLVYVGGSVAERGGLSGSFVEMFAVTALIVVLVAVTAARDIPGLLVPLNIVAAIALAIALLFNSDAPLENISPALSAHIAASLIAYGVLCTAAITSIVLWLGDRSLRGQSKQGWLQSLPPLQRIESLMFYLITIGWVLLTVGIAIGIFGIENFFGQHLAHKTVFSIISWLLFGSLILGRQMQGWRGLMAIRWTLVAFALLAVAFFGSKFVLDIILNRV